MFKWIKQKFFNAQAIIFGGGAFSNTDVGIITEADYLESYSKSNLIKSAVSRIADKTATIDLELYRARFGKAEEVEQHEVLDLLSKPNPMMSGADLFALTAIYEKLIGDAYWFKARATSGKIVELWPLRSDTVTIKNNSDGTIQYYEYPKGDGGTLRFKPEEIIHFTTPNPLSIQKGVGEIQGLMEIIRSDLFSKKWNTKFFNNNATPRGVLTSEDDLMGKDRDEIRERWEKQYGGLDNAHKVAILANGLKYQTISPTHRDMEFKEMRTMSRDDVLMTLGVPKSVMAVSDDVNRSNAETGVYVFLSQTVEPMFRRWADKLNHSLVSDFDMGLYLTYKDPTPEDEAALDDHFVKSLNSWMTVNEIRDERGLDPVEGGDVIYQGLGQMPLGESFEPIDDDGGEKSIVALKASTMKTKKDKKLAKIYKKALKGNKKLRIMEDIYKSIFADVKKQFVAKSFSDKQKDQIWKMFDVRLRRWEEYWEYIQGKMFDAQRKRIVSQLKDSGIGKSKSGETDFVDWAKEDKEFAKKAKPVILEVVKESGEYGMNLVGVFGFDTSDEKAAEWIDKKAMKFAKDVNKTTKTKLKKELADGLLEGEGIGQLAKRVNSVMKGRISSSAQTIARTEVLSASNAGTIFGYEQTDLVAKKEWLSTRDGKTREDHYHANGQTRLLKNKFNVGGEALAYPGDPNGSAAQIINCRCTVLPIIKS